MQSMDEIDQSKNLQKLPLFYALLQQQLSTTQSWIDEMNGSDKTISDIHSYYIFFQTLLLSAESYGLQDIAQSLKSITKQLIQIQNNQPSEIQKQRITSRYLKLMQVLNSAQFLEESHALAEPVVHFYGLTESEIKSVLKQIRGRETHYSVMADLTEISEFADNDILLFRLTSEEVELESYKQLFLVKSIQPSQLIYLAEQPDERLSLKLGAFGLENMFIWPNDSQFFARHFYNIYHSRSQEVRPYQVCFVGCSNQLTRLAEFMASFGVEYQVLTSPEEVLKQANQTAFDAFVIEANCTEMASSPLVSGIRQISKLKLTPIFHFRHAEAQYQSLKIGHQYDQEILLPHETNQVLCLEVLSRLSHERKLNILAQNASEAVQQESDWKTGLDVHNIMSITDKQGRIIEVNDNFCRVSGYQREELLGQNHRVINSGVHPQAFFQEMWQTISSGHVWHGEVCNRAKDGSLYWVESSVFPVLNSSGQPKKYISIRTDVTHLKNIEERLLEVQSQAKLGNWQADMRTGDLEWSDTIYDIFGFDQQSFEPCVEAFKEAIHPDDLELVELSEQAAEETGAHDVVHRIIRPDGEIRYVHELARAFKDENGELVRLVGSVQDITAMKRVEEALKTSEYRLSMSQNFAEIGTWDYSIQTGDLFWSDRISPLFGGPKQEMETTYENFVNALHPDDRQMVLDAVTDCIENNARYDIEHRVVWEDGTVRWLSERGNVLRDKMGQPLNMLGVVQDITLRKETEQKLYQATQRAELSDQAKSEFLSRMSHELRTPLNAIIGFSQLLEMSAKESSEKRQIENILSASEHLLNLINDVLDLSKVESGQMEFSIEDICLSDVINSAFQMTDYYAKEHNVQLLPPEESSMKLTVVADFMRLKQVFINLISNAIKYNKAEGQVEIKVEQEGHCVLIHFKDSGQGISEEFIDKLFIPFNRLNQEFSGIEGTGIGLAITKRFMDEMQGDISVQSVQGQGSTFTVKIPAAKQSRQTSKSSKGIMQPVVKSAIKVLCIDSEPSRLRLVGQQLSELEAHIKFLASPSGTAGVAIARREKPDLILMNIDLPDVSSTALLEELRSLPVLESCRIAALHTRESLTDSEMMHLSAFDDYLTQPFKVSDIIAEIEKEQV